ncbi:translation initiation factor 2 (IF-2, GTPase) [Aquipseudomonas ullengensis]|uniref:Translation initiation factor 2 (IF-2, GTPase) n=1 Tax=Aquipseudomonas ullengensis TaxID=2759166 RepID=A0A7W4Q9T1_9GAMM|nr:translation initiation factor 2 (IF-2, GTPase) [Pseudomonas ullengensis]MBB2494969.1 translation initiation factor 2 (IF-2, GTPase) [Pseudomonas ullengensis]
MRQGSLLSLLLAGLLTTTWAAAEETVLPLPAATPAATVAPASNESRISELQQQLAESERQRNELQASAGQESPQLSRLRQDNQRLKLQLKQAQAQQPPRLLTEQQQWYAIGVGSALLAFIVGRLSAGRRNKRRSEWV